MKKLLVAMVICVAVLGGCYVTILHLLNTPPKSDPEMVAYTEERVTNYLLDEKEYKQSDLLTVKSVKEPKSTGYSVMVTFSDEPDAVYHYQVEKNTVEQFGYSGKAEKHLDIEYE